MGYFRFHGLRHSYATLGLASRADLKTISGAATHSAIAMTARTYVHAIRSLRYEAADRIDAYVSVP